MRILLSILLYLSTSICLWSAEGEDKPAAEISAEKIAKIEKLFELSHAQEKFEVGQKAGFKAGLDMTPMPIPAAQKQKIIKIGTEVMNEVMPWKKVKVDMIKVYAKAYTEEELDGVIAILDNKDVQVMLKKEIEVIGPSLKVGMEYGQKLTPLIMQRMNEVE